MLNKKFTPVCFKNSAQESTVLKNFQLQRETKAIEGRPLIIRCDCNSLARFTQDLTKPYDPFILKALIATASDLMKYWGANLAFTHSDEIIFVFENAIPQNANVLDLLSVPYGGDLSNMLSLFAAKSTIVFNNHLNKDKRIFEKNYRPEDLPCFKATAFSVPDLQWVVHWLAWRQKEGEKNYIETAYEYFLRNDLSKEKKIEGVSLKEKILYISTKGLDVNKLTLEQRFGTFILKKKELKYFSEKELESMPEHKRPKGPVLRSSFIEKGLKVATAEPNCLEYLFDPLYVQGVK